MKKLLCKLFGHRWRYNFPFQANKAICARCHKRMKLVFKDVEACGNGIYIHPYGWEEGFDDNRTDKELINKWFK